MEFVGVVDLNDLTFTSTGSYFKARSQSELSRFVT